MNSQLSAIEQCVSDPVKYDWWLECEEAWQALAAMYDLMGALKSPNPEGYISHLHIHQDGKYAIFIPGSCNGL